MATSIFTRGSVPKGGGGRFVKIETDSTVELIPLMGVEGMIGFHQHAFWMEDGSSPIFPCIREDCPGCQLGDEPSWKATMMVIQVEGKEREQRIWTFGASIARQLTELESTLGSTIAGQLLRVRRTGAGLKTRYTVVATGRRAKIEGITFDEADLIKELGPTERGEIIAKLVEASVPGAVSLKSSKPTKPARDVKVPSKSTPAPAAEEEVADDLLDDEWTAVEEDIDSM